MHAERLIFLRTVLEKLRPIEAKLKYQIDKVWPLPRERHLNVLIVPQLVKSATMGASHAVENPLSFRPNPSALVSKSGQEGGSDGEEGGEGDVYQPPKLASVPYEEDRALHRKERDERRARERLLHSHMLDELRQDFSDMPLEIREDNGDGSGVYVCVCVECLYCFALADRSLESSTLKRNFSISLSFISAHDLQTTETDAATSSSRTTRRRTLRVCSARNQRCASPSLDLSLTGSGPQAQTGRRRVHAFRYLQFAAGGDLAWV
jgi:hypothetical protein